MRDKASGFTLVEIMFVVFIISFLLALAVIQGIKLRKMANESNAQCNLKTIASGFEIYAAGHGGSYAQSNETSLQFLVDAKCIPMDFISLPQLANFKYLVGGIEYSGYDIRAVAVSTALADHNYQILTGGAIKRSASSSPGDLSFDFY
ncbi:MAG: type II secretion system protein [Candidatus Omnitrophica bacterium]|nr:type II secretion system protein [Candidatus Omnitrophota bacterium]